MIIPFPYNSFDDDGDIHSITLFGYRVWLFYYHDGFGWFRLFGKGLKWKNVLKHGLTFSERQKKKKPITINNWRITFLK